MLSYLFVAKEVVPVDVAVALAQRAWLRIVEALALDLHGLGMVVGSPKRPGGDRDGGSARAAGPGA